MIGTAELLQHLDELLQTGSFDDYCPNGLQVEGRPTVASLAVAVTASLAVIEQARDERCDALLVHHGYFWKGEDPRVVGPKRARLAALLGAGINLVAYHLPLDRHPQLGNNARLAARLGWSVDGTGGPQGLIAWTDLAEPRDARWLATGLAAALDRNPLLVGNLERPIRRLAWCTGAAQDYLAAAAALRADAFVSGEISERTTHEARERGLIYAAAGHHATERFGVQAVAEHLATRFGLRTRFIDDPNPA
jgi:dinuclear metal center YbgI/SA1388 family protein